MGNYYFENTLPDSPVVQTFICSKSKVRNKRDNKTLEICLTEEGRGCFATTKDLTSKYGVGYSKLPDTPSPGVGKSGLRIYPTLAKKELT